MQRFSLILMLWVLASCQATNPGGGVTPNSPDLASLLVPVAQARDALQQAAVQFQGAREQLAQVAKSGGDSQAESSAAVTAHDNCVEAAVAVSSAIAVVEESANTLFQQWQIETAVYTDPQLKAENQARLTAAWQRYEGLIQVLRQSAAQMDPVLAALNAHVQSLQAAPVATDPAVRDGALPALQNDIAALLMQLDNAIARADAFAASTQQ